MSVHGKKKKRRPGVHKNRHSPETRRWERELLIPPKPDWMPEAVYVELAKLRRELEEA